MQKLPLTVFTQADSITKTVKPAVGASVAIFRAGTNILAALYQDDETTGKTNPLTSDEQGFVECKLQNGAYDILISYGNQKETIKGWVGYDGAISAVTLTAPAQFTITGGVNIGWAPTQAKKFLAGPASGGDSAPVFREIVPGDLPVATAAAKGTVELATDGEVSQRNTGNVLTADKVGLVYLGKVTASDVASVEFKNGVAGIVLDNGFSKHVLELVNVVPSTNNTNLLLTASTDGGTSYLAGTNYFTKITNGFGTSVDNNGGSSAQINIFGVRAGNSGDGLSGRIEFSGLCNATNFKRATVAGTHTNQADGVSLPMIGSIGVKTTSAISAIKLAMSAGNIASGEFILYGVRTAA